jgi:hypothetical protein
MKLQVADYLLRQRAKKLREAGLNDSDDDFFTGFSEEVLPVHLRQYVLGAPSFSHALGAGPQAAEPGGKGSWPEN